jgi:hypothetical protein
VVGAERSDEVDLRGAAHAGDLCAVGLGDLHGERADTSGRADDEDLLAGLDRTAMVHGLERGACGHRYGGRLFEGEVGRFRSELVLVGTRELGEGADTGAEDLVAGLEPRHLPADGRDGAGDVHASDGNLGGAKSAHEPHDVRDAFHEVPDAGVDPGGTDSYEDLAVLDLRHRDVPELEDLGRAVGVLHDRLHGGARVRRVVVGFGGAHVRLPFGGTGASSPGRARHRLAHRPISPG